MRILNLAGDFRLLKVIMLISVIASIFSCASKPNEKLFNCSEDNIYSGKIEITIDGSESGGKPINSILIKAPRIIDAHKLMEISYIKINSPRIIIPIREIKWNEQEINEWGYALFFVDSDLLNDKENCIRISYYGTKNDRGDVFEILKEF